MNGSLSQFVDGFFSDDVMGVRPTLHTCTRALRVLTSSSGQCANLSELQLPQEHPDAVRRLGMVASQVIDLQRATQETWNRAIVLLLRKGGWSWQVSTYLKVLVFCSLQSLYNIHIMRMYA